MTRPFQYDNFVQSQIAMGSGNLGTNFTGNPQSHGYLETSNGNQSRLSLKQKINQLLGLCKEENDGIKGQFAQVMGAEREILDLMKEELEQAPKFNNYARSNVEMFPSANQIASIAPVQQTAGYEAEPKQRSYQSFPVYRGTQQQQGYAPQHGYAQQQGYAPDAGVAYNQAYGQTQGYGQGQGYGQSQGQIQQGTYPHQGYPQPQQTVPQQGYRPAQYPSEQPYVTDYTASYPQAQYGYNSGQYPTEHPNILRSKVLQLKEQNGRLRNLASQGQIPGQFDDDAETRQLQQEVARLRAVVQDYEEQLNALGSSPKAGNKVYLLRQLKDQGEKIRQDTIALLRNKSGGFAGNASGNYGGQTGGNYGGQASGNYGGYEMAASTNRGPANLSSDQHAQLRAQLNELRMECEQLHSENANIKRVSKGTNFSSASRRY